jgi:N-dimethylarginine dimethylaminohydrolase
VSALNEYGTLRRVALRSPDAACADAGEAAEQWQALNFTDAPDFMRAIEQHAAFEELFRDEGVTVDRLPAAPGLTLDAIYVRDATIVTPRGIVLCAMGKRARAPEPPVQGRALASLGHRILGSINAPGRLEGGDLVWFNARTVAVGRGYRTNENGILQLRAMLPIGTEVVVVPLPHYRGEADVFHLMSIISPIDHDLAVVYSPLMPVPFREWLQDRGVRFVEVPDEEFASMGANVLAVAPRRCLMIDGNPMTRARLEAAGVEVRTYEGSEISVKGGGGPTCLTRPLVRDA